MTIDTKELRRLTQAATPGPWKMIPVGDGRQKFAVADSKLLSILTVTDEGGATFGTVYDDADAKFMTAANPAAISELLDRLEAAEAEALEQARLNGMGSEREAALMAKLEAAERERDDVAQQLVQAELGKRKLDAECAELYAKVEQMEQQEPVGEAGSMPGTSGFTMACFHADKVPLGSKLYTIPGAKGE